MKVRARIDVSKSEHLNTCINAKSSPTRDSSDLWLVEKKKRERDRQKQSRECSLCCRVHWGSGERLSHTGGLRSPPRAGAGAPGSLKGCAVACWFLSQAFSEGCRSQGEEGLAPGSK